MRRDLMQIVHFHSRARFIRLIIYKSNYNAR